MTSNYNNGLYKQLEESLAIIDALKRENKEDKILINTLTKTVNDLTNSVNNLNKSIAELKAEILRLKAKNDKDSSNSSKPSSTNGFKKVTTNRREKSNIKQGGQINHAPHSLVNKLNQFIDSGDIEEEIIEINKNEKNKNKRYIEKVVIDIKITKILKRYRYYPDEFGKYNIPKEHNQYVQYGSFVKSACVDLMNNLYNSTDGIKRFVEDITNGGITLSKGTLINWNNEASKNLQPQINNIEKRLFESYYLNHDESQIKIDGDGYNILCACNKAYTRLWVSEHKSREDIDKIGFLPKYHGVIVKDGTELYNKYGDFLSQCISHIQRYLKGIYDYIDHKHCKELSEFLSNCIDLREQRIKEGKEAFTSKEYSSLIEKYDNLIDIWGDEIKKDVNNYLFDDELKLWTRMKYDNRKMDKNIRGDRDEILYFLKDFKVPATNNAAEASQRGVKIKQKIGKFRSVEGAESYSIIKSCILTYKKNNINVLKALISAFEGNTIII